MDSISRPDTTPEQPARNPLETAGAPVAEASVNPAPQPPQHPAPAGTTAPVRPKAAWWRRKALVIPLAGVLALVAGGGLLAWSQRQPSEPAIRTVSATKPSASPSPTPVVTLSSLTGLSVTPELSTKPVYAVMIENLAGRGGARPQSGLADAGVVYEALAEGGITRFMALYADGKPSSIGPVRSLRPYYIDWAMEFGAALAHAGGSSDALNLMQTIAGTKDLNALTIGAPTFYRTSDRLAPHNLYTSADLMTSVINRFGFTQAPGFTPTPRKADAPLAAPEHPTIQIGFSTADYAVGYAYDAASNSYARSNGGQPHLDRTSGKQIMVKNVVVEYMPITYTPAPHDSQYINMPTVGSGKAVVFRDGTAVTGTWTKAARTERTKLVDAAGQEIKLNAGNTWYEIVPTDRTVSF